MTTLSIGQQAETASAAYLQTHKYKIRERNWRTRYCEIDIVAQKGKTIHFVEVKYRVRDAQGSGLDYITPYKLRQMRFAAELWVSQYDWSGDYALSVIEVSGPDFQVTEFLPDCD